MARLGKAGVDGVDLDSVGSERSTRTGKEGWNPPGNPPGTHWPRANGSSPSPSGRILKEDPIQPCRPGLAFRDLLVKIVGPCRNEPSHTTAAPPGPDNPHRLSAVLLAVCDGVGRWIGWQALQGNQRDVPSSPSLVPRLTPRIKVLLSTLHASPPSTCDSPAPACRQGLVSNPRPVLCIRPPYCRTRLEHASRTPRFRLWVPPRGRITRSFSHLIRPDTTRPTEEPRQHTHTKANPQHTNKTYKLQTEHRRRLLDVFAPTFLCHCTVSETRRNGPTPRTHPTSHPPSSDDLPLPSQIRSDPAASRPASNTLFATASLLDITHDTGRVACLVDLSLSPYRSTNIYTIRQRGTMSIR